MDPSESFRPIAVDVPAPIPSMNWTAVQPGVIDHPSRGEDVPAGGGSRPPSTAADLVGGGGEKAPEAPSPPPHGQGGDPRTGEGRPTDLSPYVDCRVSTPHGNGWLWQAFLTRAGVVLDADPDCVAFFDPAEITVLQSDLGLELVPC
jgi:hypothetical protein